MEVIIADLAVNAVLPEVGLHDDAAGEKLAIVAGVSKGMDATKVTGNRGSPAFVRRVFKISNGVKYFF
jgi:hypothetical protein